MTKRTSYRLGRRRALQLGLAGAGIMLLGAIAAPAIAATTLPWNAAAPSARARIVPVRARRAPIAIHGQSCASTSGILSGLAASATTLPTGSAVTLTATTSCDIGTTTHWVQIFDATTGTLIGSCGSGTSCSATVSQNTASTHDYIAVIDTYGSTYPPATIDDESLNAYVTWEAPPNDFTVSLQGPASVGYGQGPATYTAYASQNVGPTLYWIEIFDETTGTLLGDCGSGAQCSVSFTPAMTGDRLVAFVSGLDSALPPEETQASSAILTTVQEQAAP
jgi:hypothetical protein